jgi:hypothetical protein
MEAIEQRAQHAYSLLYTLNKHVEFYKRRRSSCSFAIRNPDSIALNPTQSSFTPTNLPSLNPPIRYTPSTLHTLPYSNQPNISPNSTSAT